ncbi:MAG: hypothetical protein JOY80_07115 [Candidatus Dormibacteraeota bacterium]|nr:hypothetical protein [Candidatus Dormibacteraeota bacterium]
MSDGADGALLIKDHLGTSGILLTASGASCSYTIAPEPTLEVAGNGPVPAAAAFTQVGCLAEYTNPSQGVEVADATFGGTPFLFIIGVLNSGGATPPPASAYTLTVEQGSIAQLAPQFLSGNGAVSGTMYPATVTDTQDGRILATLGGAAQGQTVSVECTAPFSQVLNVSG